MPRLRSPGCIFQGIVDHEPGERWELEITAAGKSLLRSEVSTKTASGGWLRRELDLSAFAGQIVWLSATAAALDGKPAHPAWRKLEPSRSKDQPDGHQ